VDLHWIHHPVLLNAKIVEQYRLSQPSDTAIIAADVLRWQPDSNLPALELSLDQIFKGFET
jgi:hypothetical protein